MPLKNVCSMRSMGLSEKVEANLVSFFDFGFLDKGGYFNIDINQSGDYVSNLSSLTKGGTSAGKALICSSTFIKFFNAP